MNNNQIDPAADTVPTVVVMAPALVVENTAAPSGRPTTQEQQQIDGEKTNPAINTPARATKTSEQEKQAVGQRRINLIWESTQSAIAITVTLSVVYCGLTGKQSEILGNAFTLIIAIYFVRMNHTKIGGISADYGGR